MTGFGLDPDALEAAIKRLEDARSELQSLVRQATLVEPHELVAQDETTKRAYKAFVDQASGDQPGSLRSNAFAIRDELDAKIKQYQASLEEYRRAEDSATIDAGRVNREA
ncbi:hypothetical protein GIY23_00385 [Allosaccharopolyspora coralli]|uniref:PE domain-containing protein n=1 Tax=Allosaccharopolyspora coralli TaxID=2665642 RepID=A0A5Q3Q0U1_9PSEU|nr:hypothetical protein [Allosaccharopolyspora coralli]QGK68238.1 hypothetical protein GIY23_00385 [Allosaccharopolyspora coralli]